MTAWFNEHYLLLVIAIPLSLLSITAASLGSVLFYTNKSQLADVMSHSVYPGIILSFMIFQQRSSFFLIIGAVVIGYFALICIQFLESTGRFPNESILSLVLSSFFGFGMVLMSFIQGNASFQGASQAGLNTFILGQAAYLTFADMQVISLVSFIVISVFLIYLPKIKIIIFDKNYARTTNLNVTRIQHLLNLLTLMTISVGIKAVGALLMSSLLITPSIIARQWTNNYKKSLLIASLFSSLAAIIGTYVSTTIPKIATGPAVSLTLICLYCLSVLAHQFFKKKEAL